MIRKANASDVVNIMGLCKALYEEAITHNRLYELDDTCLLDMCNEFVSAKDKVIFVDVKNGEMTGVMFGQLTTPWVSNDLIAVDVILYVKPSYRGRAVSLNLIKNYEAWAKANGAKAIQLSVSSGVDQEKTLTIYSKLGYTPQAVCYGKGV